MQIFFLPPSPLIRIFTIKEPYYLLSNRTAGVSKQAGFGEVVGLGLLESGGEAVYLDGPAGGDEGLLQHLLLVPVLAKPLLTLPPLQDDVDVAGDQRRDLLPYTISSIIIFQNLSERLYIINFFSTKIFICKNLFNVLML